VFYGEFLVFTIATVNSEYCNGELKIL
jgi:hypothetical protein